jgi:hypothetical protein
MTFREHDLQLQCSYEIVKATLQTVVYDGSVSGLWSWKGYCNGAYMIEFGNLLLP